MLTSRSRFGFHSRGSATEHLICLSEQSESHRRAISRLSGESVRVDEFGSTLTLHSSASVGFISQIRSTPPTKSSRILTFRSDKDHVNRDHLRIYRCIVHRMDGH